MKVHLEKTLSELVEFKNQLFQKDTKTIIQFVVLLLALNELYYIISNWAFFENTFELWRYLDFATKHSLFFQLFFVIGLSLLWLTKKVGWIIVSSVVFYMLYHYLFHLLYSIEMILEGMDNVFQVSSSEKMEQIGNLIYHFIAAFILITMLLSLWSVKSQKLLKVKNLDFLIVFLLSGGKITMYYMGY